MSVTEPAANAEQIFTQAMQLHQRGQLAEAERLYRDVLAVEPNHIDAMHLIGLVALQGGRNDVAVEYIGKAIAFSDRVPDFHFNIAEAYRRLGRSDDALRHFATAAEIDPSFADAHQNLGGLMLTRGEIDAAIGEFQTVLALQPGRPDGHLGLAEALRMKGMAGDATAHYRQVVATKPDHAGALVGLAETLLAEGASDEALAIAQRALQADDNNAARTAFVQALLGARTPPTDPTARKFAARALTEPWFQPSALAPVCTQMVKGLPAISNSLARLNAPAGNELSLGDLFGPFGMKMIAGDELLRVLLQTAPICDVEVERLLTVMRFLLLQAATSAPDQAMEPELLLFHAALARQCFLNDYVFARNELEDSLVNGARGALMAALRSGAPVPPLLPIAVAAYEPLHQVPEIDAMLQRPCGDALAGLLKQQVREPIEEFADLAEIPQLTEIDDAVSLQVQQQYEENPYPSWTKPGPAHAMPSFEAGLREVLPFAAFAVPDSGTFDILIAGCGTGQHSIGVAQRYPQANIAAIDLSLASLAYARRKTREAGLSNIDYAQADILMLGAIGRTFDIIESSGVLHHLADPLEGWRILLSLLRPHGFMHVGLYSQSARSHVRAAREFIVNGAYDSTANGIRRARQALIKAASTNPAFEHVARSPDFFTTSACRDLLFHVQEHQFTLPVIRDFLATQNLRLLGFDALPAAVLDGYRRAYPHDITLSDINCWHDFETRHPHLFGGMYQFWVQKAD